MSSPITLITLEHLARLARLELRPEEKNKLLKDLQDILGYVAELQSLDLKEVPDLEPFLKNALREDGERQSTDQGAGKESFPESRNGFLKVPPVFEQ